MRENEPSREDENPYQIFFEYPPNLEAIQQAIRDMGIQDQLEVSYEDLEDKELL